MERNMSVLIMNLKEKAKIFSWLFSLFLLILYFVYFLLRIDPKLIYQSQEPVFFFDRFFVQDFLKYPGGINELFSSFLSQFFYHSWTGALLLAVVFGLLACSTKHLFTSIGASWPMIFLPWVPTVFLLALHSNYTYPLALTLGLCGVVIFATIYIRFSPSNRLLRSLFYILLHSLLYFLVAGLVFVFSLIVLFYEVLRYRRIILPLLYLAFAALLPIIAASTLFIVQIREAFAFQLFSYNAYSVKWLSWLLYIFYPSAIFVLILKQHYPAILNKMPQFLTRFFENRRKTIFAAQGLFLLFALTLASLWSFEQSRKEFLLIDYYSRLGQWHKVIDFVEHGRSDRSVIESQAYRALYHSGRLCDELFRYTWRFGGDGLFMHPSLHVLFPSQHSDIFFDLGLFNEAEHWAYESMWLKGKTPWNLQRLALVNIIEGNKSVASRYLRMLSRTVWHKGWAEAYQNLLANDEELLSAPQFQYMQSVMPHSDFLVSPSEPERCLEPLLQSSRNKMAFEYYMINCLLEGRISDFINNLHRLNQFNYSRIPRHFEEAILIYHQVSGGQDIVLPDKKISEQTIRKFVEFNKILEKHNKSKNEAYRELFRYRDTYWFYALYNYQQ